MTANYKLEVYCPNFPDHYIGADILRESKLHPSVLAKIPVDTELISKLREHPLVDIFEPNVTGRYLNTTWNIDRVNAPDVWNQTTGDRKSTRLNSSHVAISYAVFCLKKNKYKHH